MGGYLVPSDARKSPLERESLCRRCGACCYQKLLIGSTVVYTDIPCAYLDVRTRLCTVYERRHEVNPECLSVEMGLLRGVFPADCPYVADIPGYRAPVVRPDPGLLGEALAELAVAELGAVGGTGAALPVEAAGEGGA